MRKASISVIPLVFALLCCAVSNSIAEQFSLFTYHILDDGTIKITDYPDDATGHVDIPEEINGKKVTAIGKAFFGCHELTSVTIPANVTYIDSEAFDDCGGLTAINVALDNAGYASIEGVLYSAGRERLIRCPEGMLGAFIVPAGVTSISGGRVPSGSLFTFHGAGAFQNCTRLTHIALPLSITEIGVAAFYGCRSLTSLSIPEGVRWICDYTFDGCSNLTRVSLPSTITGIGESAFADCESLLRITIPSSVTTFYHFAFWGCSELSEAVFLGDIPAFPKLLQWNLVFKGTAPGFTIYYLSSKQGFTSPRWEGYPTVMIDETSHPAAHWLLKHELPYDTDLHQDTNGDGVNLLTAYALNLAPRQRLHGRLPLPILRPEGLMMTFHAASPGIGYVVQTSDDLRRWTSEGVTLSDLNGEGIRTASVGRDSQRRFMRLMVSN